LRKAFNLPTGRVFVAFFTTLWTLIYRWRVVENPTVSFRRTYWNSTLVEKAKIPETTFAPVIWGFNRHAQSITLYALSNLEWLWAEPIVYAREEVPAFDHPNVLYLDWAKTGEGAKHKISHQQGNDAPVVLLIHGLGDDKEIPYMKRCIRNCLQKGYRAVVFSYWRFDFEESRDLAAVLDRIQEKFPTAPIAAIGWSAGVYPLVRYLEKAGGNTPIIAAVCQSGCLDFPQAVDDVLGNENPTYGVFLAHQGRVCVRRHLNNDKNLTAAQKEAIHIALREEYHPMKLYNRFLYIVQPPGSLLERPHERHPLGHEGYVDIKKADFQAACLKTASHYSHKAIDHLDSVAVTTLILHSEDDPVVTSQHVDWRKVEQNRHIIVGHTKRGGHCGWYEGFTPFGDTWGDRVSVNFISAVLETHSQTLFFLGLIRQSMNSLQMGSPNSGYTAQKQASISPSVPGKSQNLTPRAMARICSASDLISFPAPSLVVQAKKKVTSVNDE